MRGSIQNGGFDFRHFAIGLGLNVIYLGLAGWLFSSVLRTAREGPAGEDDCVLSKVAL